MNLNVCLNEIDKIMCEMDMQLLWMKADLSNSKVRDRVALNLHDIMKRALRLLIEMQDCTVRYDPDIVALLGLLDFLDAKLVIPDWVRVNISKLTLWARYRESFQSLDVSLEDLNAAHKSVFQFLAANGFRKSRMKTVTDDAIDWINRSRDFHKDKASVSAYNVMYCVYMRNLD